MYKRHSGRRSVSPQDTQSSDGSQFRRSGAGNKVASLKNQWLAVEQEQQQAAAQSYHGSVRSTTSSASGGSHRAPSPMAIRSRLSFEPGNDSEEEEDEEDLDLQDQSNDQVILENDHQAYYEPKPSTYTNSTPTSMAIPSPSAHFGSSQEFKVAKEGWIYKRNSLMQWRQVYAVAKHGNAVKPGSLYLYKDDKFANHIHTYDMSEVVQVEPRNQDYRAGIKWEFRLLVKKEDVILATEDMSSRQAWINSLTSIMGKVSLASHSELQSKTYMMEQANRQMRMDNAALETDNARLRQELLDVQKRERSLASEHAARESGLNTELEHVRQTLDETELELVALREKTETLEQQKMTWQARTQEMQAALQESRDKLAYMEEQHGYLVEDLEQLREEKKEWQMARSSTPPRRQFSSGPPPSAAYRHGRRGPPAHDGMAYGDLYEPTDDVAGLRHIKSQLQSLVDHIKDPALLAHVEDVKAGVDKLDDSLSDAKEGWADLQDNLVKLLAKEQQDKDELWTSVREGLDKWQGDGEKVDHMLQDIQASQTSLLTMLRDQSANQGPLDLAPVMEQWQAEQKKFLQQLQDQFGVSAVAQPASARQDQHLEKQFLQALDSLRENVDQGRTDSEKSFKVLGQLFQHVLHQLDDLDVPDLAKPLDDVMERLLTMDERLHRLQVYTHKDAGAADDQIHGDDVRDMLVDTRSFMAHIEQVLDQFGGNQAGLEATVRRAVKTALNTHTERQQAQGQDATDQLQRYEDRARDYMDRSMKDMRTHLEDCTTEQYKMTEELILRAVQHLQQITSEHQPLTNNEGNDTKALQAQRQDLENAIDRLLKEKRQLEADSKQLGKDNQQLEVALHKKQAELQVAQDEYSRLKQQIDHDRQAAVTHLARDLEPLLRQIQQFKQSPPSPQEDLFSDDSGEYIDLGRGSRNRKPNKDKRQSPLANYLHQPR
ncbi:hypothetical protein DM01DRAFT_1339353 [Hesseltinella vesiculosa]|uniref:PH domain-containing protein n=1 Tax=Hesseltinella vesiculosa TaxID=101127 RepID=A0A1X2G7I2_9FUNG|nr:hypothetical protein DM01DRAFT_1339353 [Hesseltinella vesiculosa]